MYPSRQQADSDLTAVPLYMPNVWKDLNLALVKRAILMDITEPNLSLACLLASLRAHPKPRRCVDLVIHTDKKL